MNKPLDDLRGELEAAHRRIAQLEDAVANRETGQRLSELELVESRGALQFMQEDLAKANRQIKQAHKEWMDALNAVDDPIFLHDREFRILRCNRAYQRCAGLPLDQMIGRPYYEVFPKTHAPMSHCLRAMEKAEVKNEEVQVGASYYRSRASSITDANGAYQYSIHILEDITERKQADWKLREGEERYRTLFESMLNGFAYCRMLYEGGKPVDFVYLGVNAAFEKQTGLRDVVGKRVSEVIPGIREADPELLEIYGRVAAGGSPEQFEMYVEALQMWFFISVYCPQPGHFVSVFDVITERKQHEIAMQRANRALRTISAGNQALIHATGEEQLLHEMCEIAVQVGGYRMAWIGYARDDAGKTIGQMAQAGFGQGCTNALQLNWDGTRNDPCPAGSAIISGEPKVVQDIQADPATSPWREHARQHGYASCIALPLMEEGHSFGVLVLFDDKVNVFDADEVQLLEEMSGDLAFGILNLRVGSAHREHEQRLQKNMMQTVEAIAGIVEMRDPYTFGHQSRVAELARAIARRLGLPEEEAQVIHLAGLVHDLGKIRIPAEILSKPGRLSELEYSLIKTHPQAGYDILKGIDFSWPIAQMVQQHHERLDGSGYPQGLKGEEILLGARILSVADVVEAMASHRPYRAGLGGDAALDEIIRMRGVHYDSQVVDACLSLFREEGYRLPE